MDTEEIREKVLQAVSELDADRLEQLYWFLITELDG